VVTAATDPILGASRYEVIDGDAACDVGAYESTDRTTVALAIDRVATVNPGRAGLHRALVGHRTGSSHEGQRWPTGV